MSVLIDEFHRDHGFDPATAPIPNTLGVLQNLVPQPISVSFPLP